MTQSQSSTDSEEMSKTFDLAAYKRELDEIAASVGVKPAQKRLMEDDY